MSDEVRCTIEGGVGRIRLDRPAALHALTTAMCAAMIDALDAWRSDPAVELVLIDHASGRGFCAGGDVRRAAESGARDGAEARAFFRTEYQLDHLLFTYAKPIVAAMDGVTMGGGVGIALPCRYRIATERTALAMPETAIGLFPDVGGGWYLSRLPGQIGKYLALTGRRLDGAECLHLGLATHYLPSDALDAVKAALIADPRAAERILADAAVAPPLAGIAAEQAAIDALFAGDTLEEILATLDAKRPDWAAHLRARSPQACKVALRLIGDGALLTDFADEMRMEYGVAVHVCQRPDFIEGVRAVLVDKDHAPRWSPPTPEGVTEHMIDTIFAPLPDDEQWMPHRSR